MARQRNTARIEQTKREADRLRKEIEDWTKKRREKDKQHQQRHFTQLNNLENSLTKALAILRSKIDAIPADQAVGTVYRECLDFDKRLLLVRRGWSFFQSKFDQFDDPGEQGQVLSAANEVIWSCYAGIFQRTGIPVKSAPLPYLESIFSPEAILRSKPPKPPLELQSPETSILLRDFLQELPIPIISLPLVCLQAPWWLIFLGHEVGHQIQCDLCPPGQLEIDFATLLDDQVVKNDESSLSEWYSWGKEIFADVFSILLMGPWAVWAMAELEMTDELGMLRRHPLYPPPVVRLALMAKVAQEFGVDGQAALQGFQPEAIVKGPVTPGGEKLLEKAAQDLEQLPGIVDAIKDYTIGSFGKLKDLVDWNKGVFGVEDQVSNLAKALRGEKKPHPDKSLSGARLYISAAVAAWDEIVKIDDDRRRQSEQARLAANILTVLPQCQTEGTRRAGAPEPAQDPEVLGERFARLLMVAGEEELEG